MFTIRLLEGNLTATARRLDEAAPPATFSIPEGYGSSGLQVVGVTFPSAGCWEVTQRLANTELRFTLRIVE